MGAGWAQKGGKPPSLSCLMLNPIYDMIVKGRVEISENLMTIKFDVSIFFFQYKRVN
jgi:hypothetical protein